MRKNYAGLGFKESAIIIISFFVAIVFICDPVSNTAEAGYEHKLSQKVLVAYDSKHGSTEEIAEFIAGILAEKDFLVDVETAHKVDDVSQYDAIVLGSPIYYSTFLPGALRFLERHVEILAVKKFAVFALSTSVDEETGKVNEHVIGVVTRVLEEFTGIEPIEPIGLLPGRYFLKEVFPVEFIDLKMVGFGEAGDLINYDIVRAWVEELVLSL